MRKYITIQELLNRLFRKEDSTAGRAKVVYTYATEVLNDLSISMVAENIGFKRVDPIVRWHEFNSFSEEGFYRKLLQGASDWQEYSRWGLSLVYTGEINERLSGYAKKDDDLIELQGRFLQQAWLKIREEAFKMFKQ